MSVPAYGIEGALAGLAKGKRTFVEVILCALEGFIMATVYFHVNKFIQGYLVAIVSARDWTGWHITALG